MPRNDISEKLIHFTRGLEWAEAFYSLKNIIMEQRIKASNVKIKGSYNCICLTEAPLRSLSHGLINAKSFSPYAPFGILFDKKWVFKRGGRPVIYQPDEEFRLLPEELKWRHVRYDPTCDPPIDFTWEREWRIKCDELSFMPTDVSIVVPNDEWVEYLLNIHESEQNFLIEMYSTAYSQEELEYFREPFVWQVLKLQ